MDEVSRLLAQAVRSATGQNAHVELSVPEKQFGDYTTNVALTVAQKLHKTPRELAQHIADTIPKNDYIESVQVAGPGFINITLTDRALWRIADEEPAPLFKGKKVLIEYSCPNAFKELHTGHLYNTILGDTIARLLEASGASVYRANFGGDVGMHVAKCLYGILELLAEKQPESLDAVEKGARAAWISKAYVHGAKAFDTNDDAQQKIKELNKKIYQFHNDSDKTSDLAVLYWTCREWSYDYFKEFYKQLNVTAFDAFYPESQTSKPGLEIVQKHTPAVFAESDNAVIFRGEDHGLHTRVFITSEGLPTYEAKDLGVIFSEVNDFEYDARILITGNDQAEYMKVVFAALGKIDHQLAQKQTHITNGTIRFGDGKKMSSRSGNVTRAVEVLETVEAAVDAETAAQRSELSLGAIKYAFLKHRIGGDIAFDIEESVSLHGNSGPYLQYSYARACSILAKADAGAYEFSNADDLHDSERDLVRKIAGFSGVVEQATAEHLPHYICTYLYELAQEFNRFYEKNKVVGSDRQSQRVQLVQLYARTLHRGLELLNVPALEKM